MASAAHAESRVFATGFEYAEGLATDSAGNVYVGDYNNVTKLSPAGQVVKRYPTSVPVCDITLDDAGNLYLSEWGGGNWMWVRKVAPDGRTLWQGTGQYLSASGITVAGGHVFVPEMHKVVILDAATGEELGRSPDLSQPGDVTWVADVATDGDHVLALNNARVNVLDTDGTPLSTLNLGGMGVQGQGEPWRIDVASDGRIRVVRNQGPFEVYDMSWNRLGVNDVPQVRAVAEHGDYIYMITHTNPRDERVIRMAKSFEFRPGGGQLPPDPAPTPAPGTTPAPAPGGTTPVPTLASVSINDGAMYTNRADVRLAISAPDGTTAVQVANDGGFGGAASLTDFAWSPWTLARSGAERLPKTVYVRFLPSGQTVTDDIILDETAPVIARASAARVGKSYTLRVSAKDATSGVDALQIGKGAPVRYHAKTRVKLPKGKVSVRVRDGAGNWSRAKRIK